MKIIMIDTNILIYVLLEDEDDRHLQALRFLQELRNDREIRTVVSIQVLKEFGKVAQQHYGIGSEELEELMNELKVFTPAVVGETINTISLAVRLREKYGLEYWDSLIVASCLENGVALLITEDRELCRLGRVEVNGREVEFLNPFSVSSAE